MLFELLRFILLRCRKKAISQQTARGRLGGHNTREVALRPASVAIFIRIVCTSSYYTHFIHVIAVTQLMQFTWLA